MAKLKPKKQDKFNAKLVSPSTVVQRIALIIGMVQFVIVLGLWLLMPDRSAAIEAVVGTVLLVLISTPLLYFFVVKPFAKSRDKVIDELDELANTDALTKLGNRRLLSEKLQALLENRYRESGRSALLLLDLDGFKAINDAHGHDVGDAILVEVAKRMRSFATKHDVLVRLGGDEFALLITDMPSDKQAAQDKAQQLAEMLIAAIQTPYKINQKDLRIGASVGIRVLGLRTISMDAAVRQADIPMYKAKSAGGGQAMVFQESSMTRPTEGVESVPRDTTQ